ncbi:MAG: hypothetical protein OHK93_006140 [Ramalina farinacea]|uniref:DUF3074 domain-containing protein n=1 Tax=Ramalina farinacea TaxID=258253 RepID=A0AA43QLG2_9LECA|nr:hypothetical protein [Ramalina farinacea]
MAALHSALSSLGQTDYSLVPQDEPSIASYLRSAFRDARTIVDSVPLPVPADLAAGRPRSSTTTSAASDISEFLPSPARPEPLDPANVPLQKEWGKPIKLNAKDNPLSMAVYKLGGKDGKGAWFARRSVHEGMSFKKWKLGLQKEFPETLQVQGGPGEGNIRGIGGERRVEKKVIKGVGNVEVYHLSAQFPGPTTPRDFVTLLLTSETALGNGEDVKAASATQSGGFQSSTPPDVPRHFMVVSRPCVHPDCPPRDGFIRGQYESVEYIREVTRKPRKASSATDLPGLARAPPTLEKEAVLRNTMLASQEAPEAHLKPPPSREGRHRGKTISFSESRGSSAKGEKLDTAQEEDDDELNPVEWIMITRSDPGGSVPRFMVERGTPGSIVADAGKFLNWACKKDHSADEDGDGESDKVDTTGGKERPKLEAYETNGHLAGLDGEGDADDGPSTSRDLANGADRVPVPSESTDAGGLLATMANGAMTGIETYAPQAVINRLPGHHPTVPSEVAKAELIGLHATDGRDNAGTPERRSSISSVSTIGSFASAEDHFDDCEEIPTTRSNTAPGNVKDKLTPHDKELMKLNQKKQTLTEKLEKVKEKELKDKEELTSKEEERLRKAEEKHAKEIAKQEEKYKKEVSKIEARQRKEEAKEAQRAKRAQDKDEKARLTRERDESKQQLDATRTERDMLKEQVQALQQENTKLVQRLGKTSEGKEALKEVQEALAVDARPRSSTSSSLRRLRAGTANGSNPLTMTGRESPLKENTPPTE